MTTDAGRTLARSGTFIGSFALAGRLAERLLAFGQIALVAAAFGAGADADVYFAAIIVPLLIGTLVGESAAAVALPVLVRSDPAELRRRASAGLWLSVGIAAALLVLYLAVLAPLVLVRFRGAFADPAPWLAFAPVAILLAAAAYLGAVLLAVERYVCPPFRAAAAAGAALVLTAATLVFTDDVAWVAAAVTLGHAAAAASVLAELRHVLGRGWIGRPARAPVQDFLLLRRQFVAGVGGGLLGSHALVVLERLLAAGLGAGALAAISYARGITFMPSVVAHAIAAAEYPAMVREHAHERLHEVRGRLLRGTRLTMFMALCTATYVALFGENLVGFLLQRGAFGSEDVEAVGPLVSVFAVALVANMALIFLTRVFQSVEFFSATVWMQATVIAGYGMLALVFRSAWDTRGLALAFGVAQAAGVAVAFALALRRLDVPLVTLVRRALLPALARAAVFALVLGAYRALLLLLPVPLPLVGALNVLGGAALAVAAAAALLWTSHWDESRGAVRAMQTAGRLVRRG